MKLSPYYRVSGPIAASRYGDPARTGKRAPIVPNRAAKLRVNNGEARAEREPEPRWANHRRKKCCRRQGPAAGASVESAVLRRSRHANRQRWYLVLPGYADRATGAGPIVLDHSQARGRQALSRDPGGEGRHSRRRRALPGGGNAPGRPGAGTAV